MERDEGVLIAGAGPVGLITALGVAQRGMAVTVVEAEPHIIDSPRAMVYHWTVLEHLDRLGVLREAEEQGFRKQDYAYHVVETGEWISFDLEILASDTDYPYNVHLGQHELAAIALRHLERIPGTQVLFGARVTGLRQDATGVTATVATGDDERELRAAWMLGADGARSTVRTLLGLGFDGFTWPERFVATNVFYDFEAHGYPRSVLQIDPVHGAIIAKIDERNLWRVTYSEPAALPEETAQDRLAEHYAALLPGDDPWELDRLTPYKMHQRSAESYRAGRVLLAGDAAHATNPTGGLGLTSGMFDSFALVEALSAVAVDGAGDGLLDEWAEERRRIFTEIASPQASENKRLIYSEADPERRRRDVEMLRAGVADPDALRERLHFTRRLESRATAARDRS
jgi:3-(3-hydroxy-phenyl)propionate hydroxylase/6-hydroxy-3-succinoylpyridine 3-monooxygenase